MKVNGTATLQASAEQVWAALNDPAVLVRTIPGCERLETVGSDHYRMTVTMGVASIKGTYLGDVELADHDPHSAFTLKASGSGAPGTVSADVKVRLNDQGDGTTLLSYAADAVVGGAVGGVGQRVLTGVAKKTAGEFFSAVNAVLVEPSAAEAPAEAPDVQTPVEVPVVQSPVTYTRPPKPAGPAVRPDLAAAVVGAAIALLSLLIGWRLARRRD